MPVTKTSISIYPETLNRIKQRGDEVSPIIERDMNRLYDLYNRALRQIKLNVKEACLITDCLNAILMDANSSSMLWAEIEDGINLDGLDSKWGINGLALIEKLKGLSEIQSLALVDAAERFWENHDGQMKDEFICELFNIKKIP